MQFYKPAKMRSIEIKTAQRQFLSLTSTGITVLQVIDLRQSGNAVTDAARLASLLYNF